MKLHFGRMHALKCSHGIMTRSPVHHVRLIPIFDNHYIIGFAASIKLRMTTRTILTFLESYCLASGMILRYKQR